MTNQFSTARASCATAALGAALLTAAVAGSSPASAQQSVEDFYKGKKVDVVIGYTVGGGYDAYARLVARHLGDHIPGQPTLVPRNMTGAGSRIAAAYLFNVAPKDGTAIGTADQSIPLGQALDDPA